MDNVFGMDVHRDLSVTTVKTEDGEETRYSGVNIEDLNGPMDWLREKKWLKGVMEPSGIYWVPICVALIDNGVQVTVANPYQVKAIPGRKNGCTGLPMACKIIHRRPDQTIVYARKETLGTQVFDWAQGIAIRNTDIIQEPHPQDAPDMHRKTSVKATERIRKRRTDGSERINEYQHSL